MNMSIGNVYVNCNIISWIPSYYVVIVYSWVDCDSKTIDEKSMKVMPFYVN